jgi:hypothetical protein
MCLLPSISQGSNHKPAEKHGFHSLLPAIRRWSARWDLKALRLHLWKLHSSVHLIPDSTGVPSPDCLKQETSVVYFSQQRDGLLDRIYKHWGHQAEWPGPCRTQCSVCFPHFFMHSGSPKSLVACFPWEPKLGACGAKGNNPCSQAVKLPAVPSVKGREAAIVKAAQKWTTNPSWNDSS